MINVFIVDDDFPVRMLFKQIIDWNEEGFEIIGEAIDGEEALTKIKDSNPDLILIDIEMPKKNGVEVIKELYDSGFKGKTIVISCHDDFLYVKEALKYGATDYLLKDNVNKDTLIQALKTIKKEIYEEKEQIKDYSQIKRWANKGVYTMKQESLKNLLLGINFNITEMNKQINRLKMKISKKTNLCIALEVDDYEKQICKISGKKDKELFNFSIRNIIEEVLNDFYEGEVVDFGTNNFAIIINTEDEISEKKHNQSLIGCTEKIRESINKYLDVNVTIIIGNKVNELSELSKVYHKCHISLRAKFYEGGNRIFKVHEIRTFSQKKILIKKDEEINLRLSVEEGNKEQVLQIVDKRKSEFINQYIEPENVYEYFSQMYVLWERVCARYDISLNDTLNIHNSFYDEVKQIETLHGIYNLIKEIVDEIFLYFHKEEPCQNKTIKEIINYINLNYMKDITLYSIADNVNMNMTYVSHLFKQEMNESFTEYLKTVRIEKAKYLIDTTDKKVNQIAEEVGFSNRKYFTKVFKSKVGISPSTYKNQKNLS